MLSVVASGHSCSAHGHWHRAPVTPVQLRCLWHYRGYTVLRPKVEGSGCRYYVRPHPHQASAITLRCWNDDIGMLSVTASGRSCSARGHSHHAPVTAVQLRWLWHRRRYPVLRPKGEGSYCRYYVRPHPHQASAITLRCRNDEIGMLSVMASGRSCSARGHSHHAPVTAAQLRCLWHPRSRRYPVRRPKAEGSCCHYRVRPHPGQTSAITLRCRDDDVRMLSVMASGHPCSARGHSHHALVTAVQVRWLWHRRRYPVLRPKAEGSYCRYYVRPHPHQTSAITLRRWNNCIGMLSVMASGHSCSAREHSHHAPVTPVQLRWLWHRRRYPVLRPKGEGSYCRYLVRPHPHQASAIT